MNTSLSANARALHSPTRAPEAAATTAQPSFASLDAALHARLARVTGGISVPALAGAHADWLVHLATPATI